MSDRDRMVNALLDRVSFEPMSGCWLWDGCVNLGGYGRYPARLRNKLAHRVAYELFVGEVPDGKLVLQRCGVPSCVNPDHLRLGNHRDRRKPKKRKEKLVCQNCDKTFERYYTNGPKRIYCGKACNNKAWVEKNSHKRAERLEQARRATLKTKYGLTLEEYNEMLQAQNGGCAICGSGPSGKGCAGKSLHVDHCHSNNTVRGLLCGKCNTAIGLFDEDEDKMISAMNYLRKHKSGDSL